MRRQVHELAARQLGKDDHVVERRIRLTKKEELGALIVWPRQRFALAAAAVGRVARMHHARERPLTRPFMEVPIVEL